MNAAFQKLCAKLTAAGVPDARFDAAELYRFATGRDPRLDDGPSTAEAARLSALAERRAAREPLQYILGEWDFMDFTLKVGPGVLCPRADSEIVCESALALLQGRERPVVYDLCAGTGCLGLGIMRHSPGALVTCVEKSPEAWHYLTANTAQTSVRTVQADVFTYYKTLPAEGADLIISNPPYLTGAEMRALMPETAQEPAMALDGGADGLDFYRLLTEKYRDAVRPGGWLVLEIGYAQGPAVLALGAACGWVNTSCRKDYGGNDRAVLLQKPEKSC
ncbi:peptide chain release factor N(5)-glutamine methyltransferase [Gemmiger sp.]|uniref:peptide chain release factor N(5)-glutamine methyltransferase n=1 Tax=Gemmiger sp. TaxID=2049027 RepID=UPI002E79E9D5|nr:peptide chain release factor N(5)-glutamine methyltransferase [Gemmiger sp.]MEE1423292.1 peptide chain release factor N(5)-glutamine methyltransferase [Gemmiger sp.]